MNLHRIVRRAVGSVNPTMDISIQRSTGYTTAADGTRIPSYAAPVTVQAQVQSLTYNDLTQVDGMNIQGTKKAIYLSGNWNGVVREDGKGGDIITFPDGSVYLVCQVLEDLGGQEGWVKLAVTRQMAGAE